MSAHDHCTERKRALGEMFDAYASAIRKFSHETLIAHDTMLGVIQAIYKGVEIELELHQLPNGNWTGECVIDPNHSPERFVPNKREFSSRELAKTSALEEARQRIDRRR